ncbi:MAG: arylsulfatase [Phycisphaeraceae bacterium]
MRKPNIVLICVDQMRYDCLSIAGHPAVETPHLDALAHGGTRFTQAHTAVASCIASRVALMTGLSQRTHGRVGYQDGVETNYPVTLAGELSRGGYQTVNIGKLHVHPQRNPIGFEKSVLHDGVVHYYGADYQSDYESWVRDTYGPDADGLLGHGITANSWVARPWHLEETAHPSYWITTKAAEFLQSGRDDRPFFLNLSFVAPHPPLVPPQCFFDQYLRQDLPAPPVGDWLHKLPLDPQAQRWTHDTICGILDPRAQHRAQAGYYGLITQIDHQVSRFIEHLMRQGLDHDTLIMFVSDHGELLGDHHLFRKTLPYAGSARIPLILRLPPVWREDAARTCDAVVELRDLMPTLLDAAGLPIPACVEGASLLPLVRGQKRDLRPYLHGEHSGGALSNHYIVDGRYKYIWYSQLGVEQLFDTREDPQELHDMVEHASQAEHLERLRGHLVRELIDREEGYSDGQRLIPGRPAKSVLTTAGTGAPPPRPARP